ncbi:MAG: LysR family hydrogen peroxide-inducible transcriptional activator [Planctomycetota bacterium]|jgi:LysR family hydrogen peroxide-inducible transcriptional activator
MKQGPSLRQIQYFIALAESAAFRRGARRLGVSQPTLSNQIAALENALGLKLFERSQSGALLTPAGRDLLISARRVVEEFQGFLDRAESMTRGPAGTYRLGVTATLGPYLLPLVLPGIHRKYESLKFYVREGAPQHIEDNLLAGEHDLILTPLPVSAGDLTVVPLFREPLRLVMAKEHRLASKKRIDPVDLHDEPVLTLEEHHLFHHQIRGLCERLGARPLYDYEGTSLDTLRQMVVMGIGVAFLPALYVRSEIHQPTELRVTDVTGEAMERRHGLVWRASAPGDPLFRSIADDIRRLVMNSGCEGVELIDDA